MRAADLLRGAGSYSMAYALARPNIPGTLWVRALRSDERSVAVHGIDRVVVRELCDLKILDRVRGKVEVNF